jgi:hypothetical protein
MSERDSIANFSIIVKFFIIETHPDAGMTRYAAEVVKRTISVLIKA